MSNLSMLHWFDRMMVMGEDLVAIKASRNSDSYLQQLNQFMQDLESLISE